ncbi:TIGR04222 domain-containing membrane protein, partial [Streptomyces sp. A7024]
MLVLAAAAVVAIAASTGWLVVAAARGRRTAPPATPGWLPETALEAAFLAGGPRRVVDTAISTMHADGRLQLDHYGHLQVDRPVAHHPVEGAVLTACGPQWGADLEVVREGAMRSPAVQALGDGLAAQGILYRPEAVKPWQDAARVQRWACIGSFMVLFLVTFVTADPGDSNFFSVFPVFFVAVLAAGLGQSMAPRGRLTKAGWSALAQLHRHNPWAPAGTQPYGPALPGLVAVGGVAALAAGPLKDALKAAAAGGGKSSGSAASYAGWSATDSGAAWCGSSGGGGSGCGGSSCGG